MGRSKILLLNPPGRQVYLRDYYCSKISQADYLNHPIDLLFLSGLLQDLGEVALVDAIVDRLSPLACLRQIERVRPDVVVGLIASVSYPEDVAFYKKLRERFSGRLVLTGDILIEDRVQRLSRLDFADAFLHDFSSDELPRWLAGEEMYQLANLTIRDRDGLIAAPIKRERRELRSFPPPQHKLFVDKPYRYPFVRQRRFATVLTDFGCPYPCNFCIMSTLGWKVRPLESVYQELDQLAALNVAELLLLDQTFGVQKPRAHTLLETMRQRDYGFGWVCFSRPDVVDNLLLESMKTAGCHTIILGLESGNPDILAAAQKAYDVDEIRHGFALCHRHGLRTVATIILGLPEETLESFQETLQLLRDLEPGYVSINVAVPRMGTPLRKKALRLGLIDPAEEVMDQSGQTISMPTLHLSRRQLESLRTQAVREIYLSFGSLKRRSLELARTGTAADFFTHFRQGTALLRNHWGR